MTAVQLKNYDYAIQLLQGILKSHPGFLLGRRLARDQAIAKLTGKQSRMRLLSSNTVGVLTIPALIRRDPVAALEALEKLLQLDPCSPSLNHLLRDAALAAKLPETAMFALETILRGEPRDIKTMHELARLYSAHAQPDRAVELYDRILAVAPNDLEAMREGKSATAQATIQRVGWDQKESDYRQLLRSEEEAIRIEQANRVVRDEETVEQLLAGLVARFEADPENVGLARQIAELFEQKQEWENAVNWYTHAAALTQNTDSSLVRKASELRLRHFEAIIDGVEAQLAQASEQEKAALSAQLAEAQKQRLAYRLDEARKRVERNPSDPQAQFELGEGFLEMGDQVAAIPLFQKSRQNPTYRLRATIFLGRCYAERRMYDLAVNALTNAAAELPEMNDLKKDVYYQLGLIFEKLGRLAESISFMKKIYEVDSEYRDVARRVMDSYENGDAAA